MNNNQKSYSKRGSKNWGFLALWMKFVRRSYPKEDRSSGDLAKHIPRNSLNWLKEKKRENVLKGSRKRYFNTKKGNIENTIKEWFHLRWEIRIELKGFLQDKSTSFLRWVFRERRFTSGHLVSSNTNSPNFTAVIILTRWKGLF